MFPCFISYNLLYRSGSYAVLNRQVAVLSVSLFEGIPDFSHLLSIQFSAVVSLAAWPSSFLIAVSLVNGGRAKKQMCRIYAGWIISVRAVMANVKRAGIAKVQLVGKAVSGYVIIPSVNNVPVTKLGHGACPYPACIGFTHSLPEFYLKRLHPLNLLSAIASVRAKLANFGAPLGNASFTASGARVWNISSLAGNIFLHVEYLLNAIFDVPWVRMLQHREPVSIQPNYTIKTLKTSVFIGDSSDSALWECA